MQVLDDGSGWFDTEKAQKFSEDSVWNGSNHISIATGSQWDHEELYRTKIRRWVLHFWSQWQGSLDRWEEIDHASAVTWMMKNDHGDHEAVQEAMAKREL